MEVEDAAAEMQRFRYQRETKIDKALPYYDKIHEESVAILVDIKTNLAKAAIMREVSPGCRYWVVKLRLFFNVYNLRISKEDHATLLKLLYNLVVLPGMDGHHLIELIEAMHCLLKKPELLSPNDVELDWKPLYELYVKSSHVSTPRHFQDQIFGLIPFVKKFFPVSATEEILAKVMPTICPLDKQQTVISMRALSLFLPTLPEHAAQGKGYTLWLHNILGIWEKCNNMGLEGIMMTFMARLARDNAGRIDWEPYMDVMFTRILRGLKLPVSYNSSPRSETEVNADDAAGWIIAALGGGSSTQKHLTELLKALESYFYPANTGRWLCKLHGLVSHLPDILLKRLFYERKKDLRWMTPVPEDKRLTEEDISKFVDSLRPIILQAINGNNARYQFLRALYALAWLRPSIIIPPVLERLYCSVNSQTEPHRVSSGLMFVGAVVRPMVEGVRLDYPDGPLQVLPLLTTVLSCIDPNDIMKTTCAFVLLSRVLTYVPLIDCSQEIGRHPDMTPIEEEICRSTAGLEDFLMQMVDRLLSLVQYGSMENVRHEQKSNVGSKLEAVVQATTLAMTKRLLYQASPTFFKAALNKVHGFITNNILESSVSLLGAVVTAFTQTNAEETWKVLMPPLTEAVLSNTESEDVQKEQRLNSELMYNLGLLNCLTEGGPMNKLIPYLPTLYKILERTLHLENFDGHFQAHRILGNIVGIPTVIQPANIRSSIVPYDSPPGEHLHIRDWGRSVKVADLHLEWRIPSQDDFAVVQEIYNKFLPPELELIEAYIQGNDKISREALQRSLRIIRSLLNCQSLLPFWDEAPLPYPESVVPDTTTTKVETGLTGKITMPDGSNVRFAIIKIMQRLQTKLLSDAEDDTLSCLLLIKVWRSALLHWVSEVSWQQYKDFTKWERDPLSLPNMTRMTLVTGAALQSSHRIAYFSTPLTATHTEGMLCIVELATSRYSKVRKSAQSLLNDFGDHYHGPLLHKLLVPILLHNLKQDSVENHELFKGTLYIMASCYSTYQWKMSHKLWVELVRSKPSEKLSVIRKIEEITQTLLKQPALASVQLEVSDAVVEAALHFWNGLPLPLEALPSSDTLAKNKELMNVANANDVKEWFDLQIQLVQAAEPRALHWRHTHLAMACFQRVLLREERSPPQAVRFLLQALVSDNIHIRKIAVRCVCDVLEQQKQETKYKTIKKESLESIGSSTQVSFMPMIGDGRPDAQWLQYDKDKRPVTEADWDAQRFVHKEYLGYMMWPDELKVPCPANEQPYLEQPGRTLADDEKEFDDFFLNEKNVEKLVSYNALENKSHTDFVYIIYLYTKLFRNTRDKYVEKFRPQLEKLLKDKLDTQQMCLFEILAGIIRGTKRWPFSKVSALWDWMGPFIRAAQENVCVVDDACLPLRLSTCHLKRDPYTHHWLIEILMDDPLRDGASALGCRRLSMCRGILAQKHWRVVSLRHRLLEYTKPFLAHPFKNVQNCVGMTLGKVFSNDFQLPGAQPPLGPSLVAFITSVVPEMEILKSLNVSVHSTSNGNEVEMDDVTQQLDRVEVGSSKQDTALRLFKTVSACMQEMLFHAPVALYPCFYELFELSVLLENVEKDKELRDICKKNLNLLAGAFTLPQYIPVALKAIHKVDESPSWSMRASCLSFLQVLVFQNMPIFRSRDDWVQEVVSLVVKRLEDGWLEVQQRAGEVLSGMLHCQFIPNRNQLLDDLKKKAHTKLSRKSPDPLKLRVRHAGVIGLSAFVNAFPYDVPEFVPEIIGILGNHLSDPHPIPTTIRKTLSSFQRTHTADWQQHRLCFTEEQLNALNDMVLPPSHYV